VPSRDAAIRYLDRKDGRKAAKHITKRKVRCHERDGDHELVRLYNAGQRAGIRDWEEVDE
jgi:hypothetical protein